MSFDFLRMTEVEVTKLARYVIDSAVSKKGTTTISKEFTLLYEVPSNVQVAGESGACPGCTFIACGNRLGVIGFHGVSPVTLNPYLSGWGPQTAVDASAGVNPALRDSIFRPPVFNFLQILRRCQLQLFCGYSLGGAAAFTAQHVLQQPMPGFQQGVVTFGSPRPFSGILLRPFSVVNSIRWMRVQDSVTRIPPNLGPQTEAYVAMSAYLGFPLAHWYQPGEGRQFNGRGGWTEAQTSGVAQFLEPIEMSRWAFGDASSLLSIAHKWPGYFASVEDLEDDGTYFWSQLTKPFPGESPSAPPVPASKRQALARAGVTIPAVGGCGFGSTTSHAKHAVPSGPPVT